MVSEARRLVGIDLGIASEHTVRVLDETGAVMCRRKAVPTVESLETVERAALHGVEGCRLEVVMEPTGPAWLPIAVFFARRGHRVFRVSSAKASDLRKFFSRHTKTNGIDADTLARIPLLDAAGVQELRLAGEELAALDRRVRACDRLTMAGAEHKVRIKDLVRQLLPMTPLTGELGAADLAVLERFGAQPERIVAFGAKRLSGLIAKSSKNHQGAARAQQWLRAAEQSIDLYAGHAAVAFDDLADEIRTEVRLLRLIEAELAVHAAAREDAYRWVDPAGLARSLPGVATVSGPALVAILGDADRFANGKKFRSYTGLVARVSETGNTDRKGQPMSKAGSSLLRTTLVRAADNARRQDPQLARIYWTQMVERGKTHNGAICVVAAHLAERFWTVMRRAMPYVICDNNAQPVSPDEAKRIIDEHWTVPAEVRARRRGLKVGKAPQKAPTAPPMRGDLPRPASNPRTTKQVKHTPTNRPSLQPAS